MRAVDILGWLVVISFGLWWVASPGGVIRLRRYWIALILSLGLAGVPHAFMVWFYAHDQQGTIKINASLPVWIWSTVKAMTWLPWRASRVTRLWFSPFAEWWPESQPEHFPLYWSLVNPYLWKSFFLSLIVWLIVTISL